MYITSSTLLHQRFVNNPILWRLVSYTIPHNIRCKLEEVPLSIRRLSDISFFLDLIHYLHIQPSLLTLPNHFVLSYNVARLKLCQVFWRSFQLETSWYPLFPRHELTLAGTECGLEVY